MPPSIPNWFPIDINAIPAVDAEPQAVPVATDVIALMIKAETKNNLDLKIKTVINKCRYSTGEHPTTYNNTHC